MFKFLFAFILCLIWFPIANLEAQTEPSPSPEPKKEAAPDSENNPESTPEKKEEDPSKDSKSEETKPPAQEGTAPKPDEGTSHKEEKKEAGAGAAAQSTENKVPPSGSSIAEQTKEIRAQKEKLKQLTDQYGKDSAEVKKEQERLDKAIEKRESDFQALPEGADLRRKIRRQLSIDRKNKNQPQDPNASDLDGQP